MKQFKLVALGGTFDHLHDGHKSLFTKAFSVSEEVIIGITSDQIILDKLFLKQIQPYSIRKENLLSYLMKTFPNRKYQVVKLEDIYGPTLTNNKIEALVVGPKTISGAHNVNDKRISLGLKRLKIVEAESIKSLDRKYLSSTRIRKGEIDRQGTIYRKLFDSDIIISPTFRQYLSHSHGKIVNQSELKKLTVQSQYSIAWVGDSVGERFLANRYSYNYGVFDLFTQRKSNHVISSFIDIKSVHRIHNHQGVISSLLSKNIYRMILNNQKLLYVIGEEDSAVVPFILFLPLNSLVFYGMPNIGLMMIEVNEEMKQEVFKEIEKSKNVR